MIDEVNWLIEKLCVSNVCEGDCVELHPHLSVASEPLACREQGSPFGSVCPMCLIYEFVCIVFGNVDFKET